MDFKQLRSFEAVVKYKSFTKAAEHLFISQPTISTHINQLEEEFNAKFISRTTKFIEITPLGQELYEFASHILTLEDALSKRCSLESGNTINIGASTIPSAYILPEILPSFIQKYPDIRFNITQNDSQGVIDGLLDGRFEIGLVGMSTDIDSIEFTPFYQDSMVLITPASEHYSELKRKNTSAKHIILNEPVVLRKPGSGTQKSIDAFLESKGIKSSDMNIIARLNNQESIKHLVSGGIGVAIISEKSARDYESENKIITFKFPEGRNSRQLYIACQKFFPKRENTCKLIDYLLSYYNPQNAD